MYGVNVGCTGGCLGERLNGIQEVSGSIPLISTTTKNSYSQSLYEFLLYATLNGRTPDPPIISLESLWNRKVPFPSPKFNLNMY